MLKNVISINEVGASHTNEMQISWILPWISDDGHFFEMETHIGF